MRRGVEALWSPAAQQDLIDIWGYFVKLASTDVADALVAELSAAALLIADNPHAWQERGELLPGVRGLPVHPYTIFYRIADNIPEIIRVLHERRDTGRILEAVKDETRNE